MVAYKLIQQMTGDISLLINYKIPIKIKTIQTLIPK